MCVGMCGGQRAVCKRWLFLFKPVGSRNQTQDVGAGGKHLRPLNLLTGPHNLKAYVVRYWFTV